MRATTLAAIAAAIAQIDASDEEIRSRCSEVTRAKFQAVRLDLQTAHDEEGLTTDSAPGPTQASVDAAAIADQLAARGFTAVAIASDVREALAVDVASAVASEFDARNIPAAG